MCVYIYIYITCLTPPAEHFSNPPPPDLVLRKLISGDKTSYPHPRFRPARDFLSDRVEKVCRPPSCFVSEQVPQKSSSLRGVFLPADAGTNKTL